MRAHPSGVPWASLMGLGDAWVSQAGTVGAPAQVQCVSGRSSGSLGPLGGVREAAKGFEVILEIIKNCCFWWLQSCLGRPKRALGGQL